MFYRKTWLKSASKNSSTFSALLGTKVAWKVKENGWNGPEVVPEWRVPQDTRAKRIGRLMPPHPHSLDSFGISHFKQGQQPLTGSAHTSANQSSL